MIDFPILPLLTELGLKPTEVLILAMLWQNIKNTRGLLEELVIKVQVIEKRTLNTVK